MKKIVKLTEAELEKIVKKVIKEDLGGMDDTHPTFGDKNLSHYSGEELDRMMGISETTPTFTLEDMIKAYDDGFNAKRYTSGRWSREDREAWIEKLKNRNY